MGKRHPLELRERAVAFVESGLTRRACASRLSVSVKFVNDMVKLKRETGSLQSRKMGSPCPGKLAPLIPWLRDRVVENGEITLDELVDEIEEVHGLRVHRTAVWKRLRALKLSHKKNASGS